MTKCDILYSQYNFHPQRYKIHHYPQYLPPNLLYLKIRHQDQLNYCVIQDPPPQEPRALGPPAPLWTSRPRTSGSETLAPLKLLPPETLAPRMRK